ncbi:gamma-tubulin complex component 4-like [Limulus polyphemus]|uniref:Gamma-tubulin complex component n=1 Tax=Limulus polyphemus TaxID=6850 RepID=A0ABM1SGF6_LIMPO|nr:gamma-tubulin complex component 4-like [Limulus polyphemus]
MLNKDVGRDSINTPLWQLRTHMAFLIDNLQYYLQVDVLESNFTQLEDKVRTVQDFEAIQLAHENFLTSVFSQSFLLLKPVYQCLMEIVELCLSLCMLVTNNHGQMSSQEFLHLNDLTLNFKRHTSLLFRILSSVRSHQASPHLAQLLLRIDYNKYFTRCGGQLGGNISTQATFEAP